MLRYESKGLYVRELLEEKELANASYPEYCPRCFQKLNKSDCTYCKWMYKESKVCVAIPDQTISQLVNETDFHISRDDFSYYCDKSRISVLKAFRGVIFLGIAKYS